ncbi:hypothetical protein NRIC_29360 [Enterococcus florum]|uniref:Uncharacterized protein n=1 Tax=Enterococcus florum TaxID=2480627 RepID=A0A4P5PAB8_9ENTE|nr:hypothetical protein [Enterococcus florum]GCF95045.1 hypothetical protein NRIC_29360 [Enterococcus florum]
MKRNEGYILLESLICLVLLTSIVFGYAKTSILLQRQTRAQLSRIEQARVLYIETRRFRLHHQIDPAKRVEISLSDAVYAKNDRGLLIEKK